MKKILILCCTIVLLFVLSVPCFAGEHSLPHLPDGTYDNWCIEYLSSLGSYYAYNYYTTTSDNYYVSVDQYRLEDGHWLFVKSYDTIGIGTKKAIYDSKGIYAPNDNSVFVLPTCDGSTCLATDVNLDNICDDCGLTFADGFTPETSTPNDPTEITFSKYNYCKLPDINSVWTDHDTYKAAAIIRIKDSGTYRLIIGADWINNYLYTEKYNGEDVEAYFLIGTDCMMYDLVGDVWTYVSTSSSGMYVRTATSDLVWANTLLYDDYTKEFAYTHFFSQPRLTTVMTQRGLSGVMTEILKLIPMTMACLVSYIALRKSWMFLLNLFQSA